MTGHQQVKMEEILNVHKLLTQSLQLDVVLKTLVECAKNLVEVADTVILYLYDDDDGKLKMAEGVGVDKHHLKHITFSPGESLTGKTYVARQPLLFAKKDDLRRDMANMSDENFRHYIAGVYGQEVKSAFCVPLIYKQKCLGVLAVDNFLNDGVFEVEDMRLIEMIADQSAIAIVNSRLVADLKHKNEELKRSLEIHRRFTSVVVDGGGISAILSLLRKILNQPVHFADLTSDLPDDEERVYLIQRGSETMGHLVLEKPVPSLQSIEKLALERAATAMTIELLKQNALYEKELHLRQELFDDLVTGVSDHEWRQYAHSLQWESQWSVQCLVVDSLYPAWKADAVFEKEVFIKSIERVCKSYQPSAFIFSKGFRVVVFIPEPEKETAHKCAQALLDLHPNKDLVIGIGGKVGIKHVSRSYTDANEAVQYGKKRRKAKSVVDYTQLGAERLWHRLDRKALESFVFDRLGPVLEADDVYLETLKVLIDTGKNHKKQRKFFTFIQTRFITV